MFSDPKMYVQKIRGCFTLRIMLLVWSYLRLAVSALWTTIALVALINRIKYAYDENMVRDQEFILRVMLHPVFLIEQLIQCSMLIILVVAGHKKNITLYRVYYVYAIVDFVIYLLVMVPSFFFGYNPFMDLYLSFHTSDIFDVVAITAEDGNFVFGMSFFVDVCFEVLLLWLLRKIITNMNQENKNGSEISPECSTKTEKTTESV